MNLGEAIDHLGLTESVPGLSGCVSRAEDFRERMRTALSASGVEAAMDVVAFGSLARREYTAASDVDYLVLVADMPDDPAAPRELRQRVEDCLAEEASADGASKAVGATGLFGRATGIFDIVNQVGLEGDTNFTHTIRMEILQESVSLLDQELHSQILGRTLRRYISLFAVPQERPPRFLLNDMLRYWRQITVDAQAKAPIAGEDGKAVLRYLKLGTSRKNLIASSILPLIAPRDTSVPWEEYLSEIYAEPPLARLATVTNGAPEAVVDEVRTVFTTIDLLVQRTDSAEKRERFKKIPRAKRREDEGYIELKSAADKLQLAVEHIFTEWTEVADNTRRYLLL